MHYRTQRSRKGSSWQQEGWMKVINRQAIRDGREGKGWRQWQLAAIIRRSQAAISYIESGKQATVSVETGMAIAKELGIPWRLLFDLEKRDSMPEVAKYEPAIGNAA